MDINRILHRQIKPGYQYEGLIPKYKGIQHDFDKAGNSDTYDTLKFMVQWVEKYHSQMSRIAPKLKGSTIESTVKNIYEFLYWHFQYKLDESLQQLYSPSAAWHFRKTGFDCKTFSILASCILTELGISHSFRKVKQPALMPNDWSHVYVIVHAKNKNYVIDATSHTNTEVVYLEKYDIMLKHRGLASPFQPQYQNDVAFPNFTGLACSCGGENYIDPTGLGVPFGDIKSIFSGIDCIGGSGFEKKYYENNIKLMNNYFNELVDLLNVDVRNNNTAAIGNKVANFKGFSKMLEQAFIKGLASKSWNSCSKANFNGCIKAARFFSNTCSVALDGWLNTYLTKGVQSGSLTFKNSKSLTTGYETGTGFWGTSAGGENTVSIEEPIFNYTLKTNSIPNFEINQYLLDAHTSNSFNLIAFLQKLTRVSQIISNPSNPDNTVIYDPTTGQIVNPKNKTKDDSVMYGAGAVIVIAGFLFWPSIKKAVSN